MGDDYAVPTDERPTPRSGGRRGTGGWVLDRTYSGKGFAGLLGNAADGRWAAGSEVVFVHTGGLPAVFAPGGAPSRRDRYRRPP
jgi:1-aminocyclopropane-1-carboxylate deaminase/D-cysteine desulfhydrase-like pyridoxal-dependent ACC family enzyme